MSNEKKDPLFSFKHFFGDIFRIHAGIHIKLFLRPILHFEKGATYKVKDRVIVTCNHNSFCEPPSIIRLFIRRRIYFFATKDLVKGKKTAWFCKRINCILVDKEKKDLFALKEASKVLKKEGLLVIFPEGKLSEDGSNSDFKDGASMLALRNNAPILPLYIQENKSLGRRTHICIGNLIYPSEICNGENTKENRKLITNLIYEKTFSLKEKLNKKIELCKKENKKIDKYI